MSGAWSCDCGKTFETNIGLGVHKKYCDFAKIPALAMKGGPARKPELNSERDQERERILAEAKERFPEATEILATLYDDEFYVEVWNDSVAHVGPAAVLGL